MKSVAEFVKTTFLGGVLVLVPFLLFYMLFTELMDLVITLAFPIIELLPGDVTEWFGDPLILAALILIALSFLSGLALRSDKIKSLGTRFESTILDKLPMYRAVKRLARGILGARGEGVFSCGIVEPSPGVRELVYITEDTGNGYVTVLAPLAPTGFNGPLKIIQSDKVTRIQASVGEASIPVSEWGVGLQQVVGGRGSDTP
jgi:uncharacterized membrane protein